MKLKNTNNIASSVLAGGLLFAGAANAATTFTEDFEGTATQWQTSWGSYVSGYTGTGSPHNPNVNDTGLAGGTFNGGARFGHTISGAPTATRPIGADSNGAEVISNTVALAAGDLAGIAAGNGTYTFSAWLAAYTGNAGADFTQISVQFFSDAAGTVATGGSIQLASGDVEGSSTTPSGAWSNTNWSLYTASGAVATDAQSFQITFGGPGNDTYADNISFTVVPEPSSTALLGLGGLALVLRRRK